MHIGREVEHGRSGSEFELAQRIDALTGLFESRVAAASEAEISKEQLARYIRGETSKVPLGPLLRLCEAKGVRIEWLATGRGPMLEAAAAAEEKVRYELPETFQERIARLQEVNETLQESAKRLNVRASERILGRIQAIAFAAGLEQEAIEELVSLVDQAYEDGWDDGHSTPPEREYSREDDDE